MKKAQRWTERWFSLGLWCLSFVFAFFLLQLGGRVIHDLPKVEYHYSYDNYLDHARINALGLKEEEAKTQIENLTKNLVSLQEKEENARKVYNTAKTQFNDWLETRKAIQFNSKDEELIKRTEKLDELQQIIFDANQKTETAQRKINTYNEALSKLQSENSKVTQELSKQASEAYEKALFKSDLKVFLYRLLITFPLLILAAWLFLKKRKEAYWPFVWGFTYFALFTFFVELVPYLPSYGGYVRAITGIVGTLLIGFYSIRGIQKYREKQRKVEQQPEQERRQDIEYDRALGSLNKGICPSCDRVIDLKKEDGNYCPHCGLCIFNQCNNCQTRKLSFSLYCFSCGENTVSHPANKE